MILRDLEAPRRAMESKDRLTTQLRTLITEKPGSPAERLDEMLELGCKIFEEEIGIVSKIRGDDYIVEHVYPPDGSIAQGKRYRLEETFCAITFEADRALGIADVRASRWKTHPCTRTGLLSYVGVPIVVKGERYGTLNFSSPSAGKEEISSDDLDLITEMAGWSSELLS